MGFLWKRLSGMTRGGIAGLIAVLLAAGVSVFIAGARWVNTSPQQCQTCHPELTAMWSRSHGHPADKVTCYQCHAQHTPPAGPNLAAYARDAVIPEKYLAGADRVESRCKGCHLGMEKLDKEKRPVIKLNHKIHLAPLNDGKGQMVKLGCLSCHRDIAHDKSEIETNRPKMSGCFTGECHRKDRNKDNCLRCHYQKLVEAGQIVEGRLIQ